MSPQRDIFSAVEDSTVVAAAQSVVDENVRRPFVSTFELSARTGRHALPAISSAHFTPDDEERIADAFRSAGHTLLYAVALERLNGMPSVIHLSPTSDGLRAFQQKCSHFNYVITTPNAEAMVVCTTDDYLVHVGQQSFVERCVGTTETSALGFFLEYADSPAWADRERQALVSVHAVLTQAFPLAREGTFVRFPQAPGRT